MDYATSVGYGLSQHRAADLTIENERSRSVAERLARGTGATDREGKARPGWLPTGRQLRSPRFVLPTVAIAFMGGILGFAALPPDAATSVSISPAVAPVPEHGPGYGSAGVRFIAR